MIAAPHTTEDVAAALNVSPRTVQRWCRDRRVEHCRTVTGRVRFTDDQLARLVETAAARVVHREVLTPNHLAPIRVIPLRHRG